MQLTVFLTLAFSLSPIITFRPVFDFPYPNPPFSLKSIHQQDGAQSQDSVRENTENKESLGTQRKDHIPVSCTANKHLETFKKEVWILVEYSDEKCHTYAITP